MKNPLKIVMTILLAVGPVVAQAAYIPFTAPVPQPNYVLRSYGQPVTTQDIDVQTMARIALELQKGTMIELSDYIPADEMPAYSSDGSNIANKILRQSLQTWFENDGADIDVVKQAQKLNDTISPEITVGEEGSLLSNFKMRFRPVTTEAQIRYQGAFNADLSYNISEETTRLTFAWNF